MLLDLLKSEHQARRLTRLIRVGMLGKGRYGDLGRSSALLIIRADVG